MDNLSPVNLENLNKFSERFVLTKIWKKKFSNISIERVIKSFFNISISNKKIFGFFQMDFILYIFLIKIKNYKSPIFPFTLFQLQKESVIIRIIGFFFKKIYKKFLVFYQQNFKWKNDFRLNENFRFFFEKKTIYINRLVFLIFNFMKIKYLLYNIYKSEEKYKYYRFPRFFTPRIKIQGRLSFLTFNLF